MWFPKKDLVDMAWGYAPHGYFICGTYETEVPGERLLIFSHDGAEWRVKYPSVFSGEDPFPAYGLSVYAEPASLQLVLPIVYG